MTAMSSERANALHVEMLKIQPTQREQARFSALTESRLEVLDTTAVVFFDDAYVLWEFCSPLQSSKPCAVACTLCTFAMSVSLLPRSGTGRLDDCQ
eukprot:3569752-Amphidinium_carterae.1